MVYDIIINKYILGFIPFRKTKSGHFRIINLFPILLWL